MADNLSIISPELLTSVSETEINEIIEQVLVQSKNNMEEMCELALECTTLLSSAESRSVALNNQSVFKRLIGNVTGKNQKMQNLILQDNTNALYAAQQTINGVMRECTNNRKLLLMVNDRISTLYLELKEEQKDIAAAVLMTRQAIATFYKKYQEFIILQDSRITKIEEYEKSICPKCRNELASWQIVCSYCGSIHPLKIGESSEQTKYLLSQISQVIKDETLNDEIVWDIVAKKKERTLRKIKTLAQIGQLPGYNAELETDIENLINKCKDAEFQIAVVGVMKAGKSFLMNALIGAEIASVAVNPETAALTKFRSSNGYYVKVKFHNEKQWEKLKESAKSSQKTGKDSLVYRLTNLVSNEMEEEWVGHQQLVINCDSLIQLQNTVTKYTSSQNIEHIFVAEVEVGIDKSIFNMPNEVVFVDTPGLKDPVKYRSAITKKYLKKADAVLVASKIQPLTAEGLSIITSVLDIVETNKTYIIGTQKDLISDSDSEKVVANWVEHLMETKRFDDARKLMNKLFLTSAKMELLVNRWYSSSDADRENTELFNTDDFNDLASFSGKVINKRSFNLMQMSQEEHIKISNATGISTLRNKLESTLIANYRKFKMEEITNSFEICKHTIKNLSNMAIINQEEAISLAKSGAEELKNKIHKLNQVKETLICEGNELKAEALKLENSIKNKIAILEKRGK